jgi:hypothetical protein
VALREQTNNAKARARGAIVVKRAMERPAGSEKSESEDEHSQQTGERRSGGVGNAKQFSLQMHAVRQ